MISYTHQFLVSKSIHVYRKARPYPIPPPGHFTILWKPLQELIASKFLVVPSQLDGPNLRKDGHQLANLRLLEGDEAEDDVDMCLSKKSPSASSGLTLPMFEYCLQKRTSQNIFVGRWCSSSTGFCSGLILLFRWASWFSKSSRTKCNTPFANLTRWWCCCTVLISLHTWLTMTHLVNCWEKTDFQLILCINNPL